MSNELRLSSEKRLRIFTGRGYPELAEEVAGELGFPITPTSAYDFANGEIFIRFEESVRGCDAFVIQSHTAPVNKQLYRGDYRACALTSKVSSHPSDKTGGFCFRRD